MASGSALIAEHYPRRRRINTRPDGAGRLLGLRDLAGVELDLLRRARDALLQLLGPLELRVEFDAEEQRHVGQPEPDEEDDHAGERAVRLVVAAEVGDVEREQRRRDRPD